MRLFGTLGLLLTTVTPIFGLHFYLEAGDERCFIEELPSETVVEGAPVPCPRGVLYADIRFYRTLPGVGILC